MKNNENNIPEDDDYGIISKQIHEICEKVISNCSAILNKNDNGVSIDIDKMEKIVSCSSMAYNLLLQSMGVEFAFGETQNQGNPEGGLDDDAEDPDEEEDDFSDGSDPTKWK